MSTALAQNNSGAAAPQELFKPLGLQESLATMLAEPHGREDAEEVLSIPHTETETELDLGELSEYGPMTPSDTSSAFLGSSGEQGSSIRSQDTLRSPESLSATSFGKESMVEEPRVLEEELREAGETASPNDAEALSRTGKQKDDGPVGGEEERKERQLDVGEEGVVKAPSAKGQRPRNEEPPPPAPDEKTDRYGFYLSDRVHRSRELGDSEKRRRDRIEARRTKKWLQMMKHWGTYERNGKLKTRIRKGIPDSIRGTVWCRLSEIPQYREEFPTIYASLLERLGEDGIEETDIYQTIERDISRTFPKHEMFGRHNPEGQNLLRRVLHAYSLFDEELGYCQGMGFIVAMFLSYMTEEDAFYLLVRVVNRPGSHLRGLYIRSMPMVLVMLQVFDSFIGQVLPRLKRKFVKEGIDPSMFATEWFVTIFTASFPFDLVTRVWDAFLNEGWKIVYRVALALLQRHEKELLLMNFDEILTYVKRELPSHVDGEAVMRSALRIGITRKQISNKLAEAAGELEMRSTNFAMENRCLEPEEHRSTLGVRSVPSPNGSNTQK